MAASSPKELYNSPRTRFERGILTYDLSYYFTASTQAEADAVGKDFSERRSFPGIDTGSRQMYAKQVQTDKIGANAYMMYVTASVGDDSGAGTTTPKSKDDFATWVQKDMGQKEHRFQLEWFGIRKATPEDCALAVKSTIQNSSDKKYELQHFWQHLQINGTDAKPGDFIYRDSHPIVKVKRIDKSQTNPIETMDPDVTLNGRPQTKGSPNSKLFPYSGTVTDEKVQMIAGTAFKVPTYRVSFYTRTRFNQIPFFAGVSGSFGSSSRRNLDPYDVTTARWLAIEQNFSYTADKDGDIWTKVTRSMEASPYGYVWDVSKSIYGTWTWGNL